mgnify:CR=1 FL=1
MTVEVGSTLEGKILNIMPFGAFVALPEGKTGLVHISEVSTDYVENIKDRLSVSQVVRVKVVGIDEKGKISLSIKRVLLEEKKNAPKVIRPADQDWSPKPVNEGLSFEDKLSKFKSDSDERMQDIKRNTDSKRSGGYRRSAGSY